MIIKYEITNLNLIKTAGLSVKITGSHSANYKIIRNLWMQFNRELNKIKIRSYDENWIKYGITFKRNGCYWYMASINQKDIKSTPDYFLQKEILKGKYINFIDQGRMYDIKNTINNIYKKMIPKLDINVKPYDEIGFFHFEEYTNKFNWNYSDSIINIYLPL